MLNSPREQAEKSRKSRRVGALRVCSRRVTTTVVLAGIAMLQSVTASADRPEPVPLYGAYDTYLDHAKQTFNGRPQPSDPSVQAASFTTTCDAKGCTAQWFRLTDLAENPNAPALFDYRWNVDRWESNSQYPFHCDGGGTTETIRSDFLKPNGDGTFYGERTFTVVGEGCPGDGPGSYWLPFTLTPTGDTPG